ESDSMSKVPFSDFVMANKPLFRYGDDGRLQAQQELQTAAEHLVMTPMQASKDPRLSPALHRAVMMAARLAKFEVDPSSDKKVSITALDRATKEAGLSIEDRFLLKSVLANAKLL